MLLGSWRTSRSWHTFQSVRSRLQSLSSLKSGAWKTSRKLLLPPLPSKIFLVFFLLEAFPFDEALYLNRCQVELLNKVFHAVLFISLWLGLVHIISSIIFTARCCAKRGMCCRRVSVCVCVFVILRYCIKMAKLYSLYVPLFSMVTLMMAL